MTQSNIDKIILGPVVTEKTIGAQSTGLYSFWVSLSATKHQISTAFTTIFKEKPLNIRTITLKGKVKNDPRRRFTIHKSDRKKAYITIAKDKKLELLNLNNK